MRVQFVPWLHHRRRCYISSFSSYTPGNVCTIVCRPRRYAKLHPFTYIISMCVIKPKYIIAYKNNIKNECVSHFTLMLQRRQGWGAHKEVARRWYSTRRHATTLYSNSNNVLVTDQTLNSTPYCQMPGGYMQPRSTMCLCYTHTHTHNNSMLY